MVAALADEQVKSSNTASPLQKNYYAIGDCCTTPGWKTMQGAQADAAAVAPKYVNGPDLLSSEAS